MDSDAFRHDLSQSSLVQSPPSHVEQLVTLYNETFLTLLDKHTPETKKLIPDRPDDAWYNADVGEAKKVHCHAERRFRKSGLEVHKQLFRQACNKCTQMVRKAKTDHIQGKLDGALSHPQKTFSVNKLLGKDASPPTFPDLENNVAADLLTTFFP